MRVSHTPEVNCSELLIRKFRIFNNQISLYASTIREGAYKKKLTNAERVVFLQFLEQVTFILKVCIPVCQIWSLISAIRR